MTNEPYIPLAGGADDGWSKDNEATATCFCGAVQLAFVHHRLHVCVKYRASSGRPGRRFLRIGTVDDFHLHETKLRPKVEFFTECRVEWLKPVEGVQQMEGQGARQPEKKAAN
ncbi:hypothetical protein C8J57DRAFT_1592350 [Mycena rebaudengoi]|nr:hypothetical protein C8J57DRAFT_1592350 [Mycena rebaudengoi]